MTLKDKLNTVKNSMLTKSPATNSGLAKVAVSFSADTFLVNQTLVLRINICGKNHHLRQASNRFATF